jgi:DNA-binding beta-propeller fold protein YncE
MAYTWITLWDHAGDEKFDSAQGVAVDSSFHTVYVADNGASCIQIFRHDIFYKKVPGFNDLTGVAADSSAHVFYAAEFLNLLVKKFRMDGAFIGQFNAGDENQLGRPQHVGVDSEGNVYVRNAHSVQKFSSGGSIISWPTPEGGPIGVDPKKGDVYVDDSVQHRILKYDSNGVFINTWHNLGPTFGIVGGIAVDEKSNVFVSFQGGPQEGTKTRIEKFTKNASSITSWGKYGSGKGQFKEPFGVAVDNSSNKVYVADWGNSRIQVFGWT